MLHHEILPWRACPVPSVYPFKKRSEVASDRRDVEP